MEAQSVDHEYTLAELLPPADAQRLVEQLASVLAAPVCIVDCAGTTLAGTCPDVPVNRATLTVELEPVGALLSSASALQLHAAAALTQHLLRAQARYRMAAALHQDTVDEDFRRLLEKHAALEASEARYRALAERLEERVAEQVHTIENAQRQLYQAEKLASVGQLAAGMAHEINNPIGFIRSNLVTARDYVAQLRPLLAAAQTSSDATIKQRVHEIDVSFVVDDFSQLLAESLSGAERIARIVADLKAFSRVGVEGSESVDLNELIRRTCNIAAPRLGERIIVEQNLGALPQFDGDGAQLGQVLLNLLLNSGEAMAGQGCVRFISGVVDGFIEIRIQDDGCGIPPEVVPRIFDPFFTTKDVGQGTGLGLTVSHDIVTAHGGTITVDTELGKGTTFTIRLPATSAG